MGQEQKQGDKSKMMPGAGEIVQIVGFRIYQEAGRYRIGRWTASRV